MKKIFAILAILAFFMVPAASMAMVQTTDADLAAITAAGVELDITPLTISMLVSTFSWGDYNTTGAIAGYTQPGFVNVAFYGFPMHILVGGAPALIGGSMYPVMSLTQLGLVATWQASGSSSATTMPTASSLSQLAGLNATATNLQDLIVDINIGTKIASGAGTSVSPFVAGATVVKMNFVNGVALALDAVAGDIILDHLIGAVGDYASVNKNTPYGMTSPAAYNQSGLLGGNFGYGYGATSLLNTSIGQLGVIPAYSDKTLGLFGISGINMTIQPFSVMISAH
jgi:hypothetical protein